MAQLLSIVDYLDKLLDTSPYNDASLNGLQVECSSDRVERVTVAVDSGYDVLEEAVRAESDLLIVHHGLFWGGAVPLRGPMGRKVELLYKNRCSLYASHLPLDGDVEVGNAHELARLLRLTKIEPFLKYGGGYIGAKGTCASDQNVDYFLEPLASLPGALANPLVLRHGPSVIRTVAVVTGSGASAIPACAEEGIDLLISGEPKQEVFHSTKELGINAIFAGHYATETLGVRAVLKKLLEQFDIDGKFIDIPTGI